MIFLSLPVAVRIAYRFVVNRNAVAWFFGFSPSELSRSVILSCSLLRIG